MKGQISNEFCPFADIVVAKSLSPWPFHGAGNKFLEGKLIVLVVVIYSLLSNIQIFFVG